MRSLAVYTDAISDNVLRSLSAKLLKSTTTPFSAGQLGTRTPLDELCILTDRFYQNQKRTCQSAIHSTKGRKPASQARTSRK